MNPLWLLKMTRWLRHPPSRRQVQTMAVVLVLVLAILGLEHLGLWPDWARVNGGSRVFKP